MHALHGETAAAVSEVPSVPTSVRCVLTLGEDVAPDSGALHGDNPAVSASWTSCASGASALSGSVGRQRSRRGSPSGRLARKLEDLSVQFETGIERQLAVYCSNVLRCLRQESSTLRERVLVCAGGGADPGASASGTDANLNCSEEEPRLTDVMTQLSSVSRLSSAKRRNLLHSASKASLSFDFAAKRSRTARRLAAASAFASASENPAEEEAAAMEGLPEALRPHESDVEHRGRVGQEPRAEWIHAARGDAALEPSISEIPPIWDRVVSKGSGEMFTPWGFYRMVASRSTYNTIWRTTALSSTFEFVTSVIIMLNCAALGYQAHREVDPDVDESVADALRYLEHFFTAYFLLDFLLKLGVFGWRSFIPNSGEGRSNFMDAFLAIVTGVVVTWIVPVVASLSGQSSQSSVFRGVAVLRAIRLARLMRVFRKVPAFREAWMLIRGLGDSARTLFWTIVVIFFVIYTFAVFGMVLVVNSLQDSLDLSHSNGSATDIARLEKLMSALGGVDRLMYLLVQILCGEPFHEIMSGVLNYVGWAWLYFYAYVAVAVLVLMNLVTAIIVENALETSRNDHEQQLAEKEGKLIRECKELKHLFTLMDIDGSNTLSWDEFKDSFRDERMCQKWMLLDFKQDDCKELFQLLDDGDGEIVADEFFEGLQRMRGMAQSKDVFRLQKTLEKTHYALGELLVSGASGTTAPL